MRAWRSYVTGSALLAGRLNRDLVEAHDLTLADYEILVRLAEQPQRRMRMSQLAGDVVASKSRLSHQIGRLERDGLVRREECPSDARGVFAVLTDEGYRLLAQAAPTHLRGVRANLVDLLSETEREVLTEIFERITARLRGAIC